MVACRLLRLVRRVIVLWMIVAMVVVILAQMRGVDGVRGGEVLFVWDLV
jgi:hypothetical protein